MTNDAIDHSNDPLLVTGMRCYPTGEVRHIPIGTGGMAGTSTRGFLTEYDQALQAAYQAGFTAAKETQP